MLGFSLSPAAARRAQGPAAPVPYNNQMVQVGDSRTAGTLTYSDNSGLNAAGLNVASSSTSLVGWIEMLSRGRLLIHYGAAEYGIGAQDSGAIATIPRATASKGIDYVAQSAAAVVVLLMGTNDSGAELSAADPGKGNGTLAINTNTRSNVRYLIEYLTDPAKNASVNQSLGINGGACNLFNNLPKTIILCNELPRGRYVANGGAVTLGSPAASQADFYAFSRWLLTLGYERAGGYAQVIALNSYDAIADYTTIPDNVAGRPADAAPFGGGSLSNSDTFLPVAGAYYDGLHLSANGALLAGRYLAQELMKQLSPGDYFSALFPAPGNESSFLTPNPRMTAGAAGSIGGTFASVTGQVPTGLRVSGTRTSGCDLTITSRTDTDGETVWRFQGTGTKTVSGSVSVEVGFSGGKSTWSSGVLTSDDLRAFSKVRLLAGSKVNGLNLRCSINSDGNANYGNFASSVAGQTYAQRLYLHDDMAGVNAGIADWMPLVCRVNDLGNMAANPTQPPFGNMNVGVLLSLFANDTDAAVGSAISFDFEMKGFGVRKVPSG